MITFEIVTWKIILRDMGQSFQGCTKKNTLKTAVKEFKVTLMQI